MQDKELTVCLHGSVKTGGSVPEKFPDSFSFLANHPPLRGGDLAILVEKQSLLNAVLFCRHLVRSFSARGTEPVCEEDCGIFHNGS